MWHLVCMHSTQFYTQVLSSRYRRNACHNEGIAGILFFLFVSPLEVYIYVKVYFPLHFAPEAEIYRDTYPKLLQRPKKRQRENRRTLYEEYRTVRHCTMYLYAVTSE